MRCKQWRPDEVVLLPLYPQYSTTTTGSSLTAWREAAASRRTGRYRPRRCAAIPPTAATCAATVALLDRSGLCRCRGGAAIRRAVACAVLGARLARDDRPARRSVPVADRADGGSRVLADLGRSRISIGGSAISRAPRHRNGSDPSTDSEIERAAHDKAALLVVPIAFVSEHSETLVELDVEYRDLAERLGVPGYFRVPTQNGDAGFIAALAGLVRRTIDADGGLCSAGGGRICPAGSGGCAFGGRVRGERSVAAGPAIGAAISTSGAAARRDRTRRTARDCSARSGTAAALISCSRRSSVSARASRWSWMTCGVIRISSSVRWRVLFWLPASRPRIGTSFSQGMPWLPFDRVVGDQPGQPDRLPILHHDARVHVALIERRRIDPRRGDAGGDVADILHHIQRHQAAAVHPRRDLHDHAGLLIVDRVDHRRVLARGALRGLAEIRHHIADLQPGRLVVQHQKFRRGQHVHRSDLLQCLDREWRAAGAVCRR